MLASMCKGAVCVSRLVLRRNGALRSLATQGPDTFEQPAKARTTSNCVWWADDLSESDSDPRQNLPWSPAPPPTATAQIRLVAPQGVFVTQELDMRTIKWLGCARRCC